MHVEETVEPQVDSIRSDLEKAFADTEAQSLDDADKSLPAPKENIADNSAARDASGKFQKKTETLTKEVTADVNQISPPKSWKSETKDIWAKLPEDARKVIESREAEVEQGFTKLDEDRNFGKSLKEVIAPYLPIITAEGGTPASAVKDLLNTAYILRTAPIAQKTALFRQLAQQYGVDLTQNNTTTVQPDQILRQTQQQLADLQKKIEQQPEVFRQQQENLAVKSQIDAFAADPKNTHYEKLKPVMASLLQTGQAKDLQDAYDKASWADPDVRSSILAGQTQAKETQRIADIKAKADNARKKAVSVRGSPGVAQANGAANTNSIREDLEAAFEMHS